MRDGVYEFHYAPLTSIKGEPVASLQLKLINPDGMGDACSARVMSPHKKPLMEGRCTLKMIRGLLDDGVSITLTRNVVIERAGDEFAIISKFPHPAFQCTCSEAALRSLLAALWNEYSDF